MSSNRIVSASYSKNRETIPGGVVSANRATTPEIAFARGAAARVWDGDGSEYIDYHSAFAAYVLGQNDPDLNSQCEKPWTITGINGAGTNSWVGRTAGIENPLTPRIGQRPP